jgi:hypothetical protein
MLGIIVAVVAGAWAALAAMALGADKAVAVAIGAVAFVLSVTAQGFFAIRAVTGIARAHAPKFPSPPEEKS